MRLQKRLTPCLRLGLSLGLLTLGACLGPVMINGKPTPRQSLEYTGQPYALRHLNAHPQPGGASSGVKEQGGRITACLSRTRPDSMSAR